MNDKIFIDTNIIVYAFSNDTQDNKDISRNLLDTPFLISMQVIFEFINVSTKKLKYTKLEAVENAKELVLVSEMVFESEKILNKSIELFTKYSLQIFDSKIIATALLSGCNILYSEDLQDGLVIENKLRIINPFLNK